MSVLTGAIETVWPLLLADTAPPSNAVVLGGQAITGIVTILVAYFAMKTRNKVNEVVTKVAEVVTQAAEVKADLEVAAETTDKKLSEITQVVVSSHELINGGRADDLEIVAVLTRQLADEKPTPKRIAAAEMAEKKLAAHRALEQQTKETVAAVVQSASSITKRQADSKGSIHE